MGKVEAIVDEPRAHATTPRTWPPGISSAGLIVRHATAFGAPFGSAVVPRPNSKKARLREPCANN
ncbi:hypothetical protein CR492_17500 [Methylocella silvestris]|uniref:Uncharacterized protein n=1 Tax=Methylocella silvestris TaxID=199596 RepID=A0A2J7TCZ2_METSI|nr:hypothetical protein CR492_17500 [Methylocella silvestris]